MQEPATANRSMDSARWGIAVAAIVMQLALGAVYAWSVFVKPLKDLNHWSTTEVSLTGVYLGQAVVTTAGRGASRSCRYRRAPNVVDNRRLNSETARPPLCDCTESKASIRPCPSRHHTG